LTKKLAELAAEALEPEDMLTRDQVDMEGDGKTFVMPDCANCEDSCCVHEEPDSGILLSLKDVANLIDSGLEDLIVGTYTFKKKRGRITDEIDQLPRLAKKQGNCIFYDPATRLCTGYGYRPVICRRFPYEVHEYKDRERQVIRFIPWAPCPKLEGPQYEHHIRQMAEDSIEDDNISFEDAVLLGDYVEELRELGFDQVLPPPEECPD
jgi:Fe-S-cluster containining protein